MTEAQLFQGYRDMDFMPASAEPLMTVQCACGGKLTAPPKDATRVRMEVERHQWTRSHQVWWAEVGL